MLNQEGIRKMRCSVRIVCAALFLSVMLCALLGCDEKIVEKVGYFEGTSFFMNGTEYTRVEETSDTVYIKGGFIGISDDGKKSI